MINNNLSMIPDEYVTSLFKKISGIIDSTSNQEVELFWTILKYLSSESQSIVKLLVSYNEHECKKMFVVLLNTWANIAGEVFPKRAAQLPDAELEFASRHTGAKYALVSK